MKVIELNKETETKVVLFFLKNIKDTKTLRQKIVSGELDCCAVKPTLFINYLQIAVAANKAAVHKKAGKLATRCLNTELLFNLSISRNISQSLNKFGLDDKDDHALIVVFEENGENKIEQIKKHLEGDICDVKEISEISDVKLIKKAYKISDTELEVSDLADSVISRIATKEFGTF